MSRTDEVDLSATRDLDPVPEDDLEEGDVVRVAGLIDDDLGVVVSGPPSARVALAGCNLTVRAESGPVIEILDHLDGILGVDAEGQFHCYREAAGEVVVQDAGGEVELRQSVSSGAIDQWLHHVDVVRGWQTRSRVSDTRGWFG